MRSGGSAAGVVAQAHRVSWLTPPLANPPCVYSHLINRVAPAQRQRGRRLDSVVSELLEYSVE